MRDNTQQHTEIWNFHLIPLHWSKAGLKIISPYATDYRAMSGIAAWCSLSKCLCVDKLVACFPVADKHLGFCSFPVVGRKHNYCLSLLAVNNSQSLNGPTPVF